MSQLRGGRSADGRSSRSTVSGPLILSNITKSFGGVEALRGAGLVCQPGEVHALIGENGAGKSTLVKVLAGAVRSDGGEILLDRERLHVRSPADAYRLGIGTVFQELSLIPDLNVAANLYYGREPGVRAGRINLRALKRAASEAMSALGIDYIDPDLTVRDLSLADKQVVEIMKALIRDPRVLVLDEATSALLPAQVQWLFREVREFAHRGRIVVFISHRLDEIRALSDRVTVLRGGQDVGSGTTADISEEYLVKLMLGRGVEQPHRRPIDELGDREVVCEIVALGSPPRLHDVSLKIHRGEIVGIGGLQGQGQLELFLSLYGARRSSGKVLMNGAPVRLHGPASALRAGIALIPEDRTTEGLCLSLGIRDNISLGNLGQVSTFGLIRSERETRLVRGVITALRVVLRNPRQEVSSLSGGNQQKVLLGRVIARKPSLLLMYDATRGVDVGTKTEIYRLMREECKRGAGILFYSSDVGELANLADRVVVLLDGTPRAHLTGAEVTEHNILAAAIGGLRNGVTS